MRKYMDYNSNTLVKLSMNVICIPTHKTRFDWFEEVSLSQMFKVFEGKYDICFCIPESNYCYFKGKYGIRAMIQTFPNEFFSSEKGYNELCLSIEFYRCFEKYSYMLLYQLDAFVFSDMLDSFCGYGFDYIGPDILDGKDWNLINTQIGCGGFSLRNISSAIRVLTEYEDILNSHPLCALFNSCEDVFWGFCGHSNYVDFSVPTLDIANTFAVTYGAKQILKEDLQSLPFGTHAWERIDYDFWKQIIEKYGYSLPSEQDINYYSSESAYIQTRRYRTIYNSIKHRRIRIKDVDSCSLWGGGYNGIRLIRLLNCLGIRINHIFDWNTKCLDGVEDIKAPVVNLPTIRLLKKLHSDELMIVTTKLDKEISGKIRNIKYILFDDLIMLLSETVEKGEIEIELKQILHN